MSYPTQARGKPARTNNNSLPQMPPLRNSHFDQSTAIIIMNYTYNAHNWISYLKLEDRVQKLRQR